MDETTLERDAVADLVAEACGLMERAARCDTRDERLALELALLHAELCSRRPGLGDAELADDTAGTAEELERALGRLERLPPHVAALTG